MKTLIILLVFNIIFLDRLYCQSIEVIEIDSITNSPQKTLPFDVPFILKVKQTKRPSIIMIIEHKGKKTLVQTMNSVLIDTCKNNDNRKKDGKEAGEPDKSKIKKNNNKKTNKTNMCDDSKSDTCETYKINKLIKLFSFIPDSDYWIKGKYLYIKFDYIPYKDDCKEKKNNILKPSKNYSIFLFEPNDIGYKIYYQLYLFNKSNEKNSKYYYKAYLLYDSCYRAQENILGKDWAFLQYRPDQLYDSIYNARMRKMVKQYIKLDSLKERTKISNANKLTFKKHPFLQNVALFIKDLDSAKCDLLNINKSDFFDLCNKLYHIADSNLISVIEGEISLNGGLNSKKEIEYSKKKENCKKSIKQIEELEISLDKLSLIGLVDSTDFRVLLSELKSEIINNQINIQNYLSQDGTIKMIVNKNNDSNNLFFKVNNYSSTTAVLDFEKRSKFQITPDFGWIWYGLQEDFNGFSPYLGFHINFRYINKNIPFSRLPNKTFADLHYWSFMTAWSLTSISEEGKRENFFANSTLLTGIGFRFCNALRATAGVNWFYKLDPNPTIETKSIAVTPYIGLSVDLDVKQFLNGFTDLKLQK